jgi:hypothetical protein
MSETLPLAERLKRQMQNDQETILDLIQARFSTIERESSATLQNALSTIENDTQRQLEAFRKAHSNKLIQTLTSTSLLWPALIALSVLLGLLLGSLGMSKYLGYQLQTIQEHRQTINVLEQQSMNLSLTFCGDAKEPCALIDRDKKPLYTSQGEYRILKQRN